MIDITKYMGIPYKLGGRDFSGCDCYGLLHLMYAEEFKVDLPGYLEEYEDYDQAIRMLGAHMSDDWYVIGGSEAVCTGDAAVFWGEKESITNHVGFMIDSLTLLTMFAERGTRLFTLDSSPVGQFMRNRIIEYRRNVHFNRNQQASPRS